MFTGIVEGLGKLEKIESEGSNVNFTLCCSFASELKIDQSLAHNGACLTVVACDGDSYVVTAINETILKTNLCGWKVGDKVNLERCMRVGDRLDGHMVQGHVDTIGKLVAVEEKDGSYELTFTHKKAMEWMTVPKGSITVNGISLTVINSEPRSFSVALIPYTWKETNMSLLKVGELVNLEFDVLGKYISRMLEARS